MRKATPLPSQEYLGQCFTYSPTTGTLIWRQRPREHFCNERTWRAWNVRLAGRTAGAKAHGYLRISLDQAHYYAHRIIWKLVTGEETSELDHKDRNGLNNRFRNLRVATHIQNSWNKVRVAGRLPKGVYQGNITQDRYNAKVRRGGKCIYLGVFDTLQEAHAAYCAYIERNDGEFTALKGTSLPPA